MFCRYCGNQLPENAKFCSSCGAKVDEEVQEVKHEEPQVVYVKEQTEEEQKTKHAGCFRTNNLS